MTIAIGEPAWIRRLRGQWSGALGRSLRDAGRPLLFGVRLWASVCLALYIAFYLDLDNEYWAGLTAAVTCQPHLGASLRKGWYRMVGTVIGAVAIVVLTAWFPQARAPFVVGLALWGAACALVATLLRNFASYSAALAGYTAAIIASDELGATGGPNANEVFLLAVTRASEICIGIVSAGIVLAGTDFGGARRRLAASFAAISAEIMGRFTAMLALAGPDLPETLPIRRELARRVIALDPVIDQAKGESSQIRYHSPVLQIAVDGLFAALLGWRIIAVHLARMPDGEAREAADAVLRSIPQELRLAEHGTPAEWVADPARVRELCETTRTLTTFPTSMPSMRLIADQTAKVLAGISDALNGLALLAAAPVRSSPRGSVQIRVPDWLPSLVNAGRAFIVIGAVVLFWIMTEWPNGAFAINFAAIVVLLLSPQADRAFAAALNFTIGIVLGTIFTAIIAFAVLPGLETFEAFSLVIGLYLIPIGALVAQPRRTLIFTAMVLVFVPLLAPSNEMSYDTEKYYNSALAILAGSGAGALSFRLLPPLSPVFRARRLLALTLRDLRHLAAGRVSWTTRDWESHLYGRLEALPDEAAPVQRSQLLTALSAGTEIIHLCHTAPSFAFGSDLDAALDALARGSSGAAASLFAGLDSRLASLSGTEAEVFLALQARGSILVIIEALTEHAAYFEAGEHA